MLLRDTPQAFAEAVLAILDDPALGERIGREGREWVVRQHAWTHSAALLRDAYDKLIGHEHPTPHLNRAQREALRSRLQDAIDPDGDGDR